MHDLLQKTRRMNKLLLRAAGQPVSFDEMAEVLKDSVDASIIVLDRKGEVLGTAKTDGCPELPQDQFPSEFNRVLLDFDNTLVNTAEEYLLMAAGDMANSLFKDNRTTVIPVVAGGDRLGTLLMIRKDEFTDDDLVLGEYGGTMVGVEILRVRVSQSEAEERNRAIVQMALDTLSYSEQEAVEHIFQELGGREGLLVASKIADRVGITRSVIVNALRKFESAGVIESRSLGMKGTFIRVLNPQLLPELERLANR